MLLVITCIKSCLLHIKRHTRQVYRRPYTIWPLSYLQCVSKPDLYDEYIITSPIHNIHYIFGKERPYSILSWLD